MAVGALCERCRTRSVVFAREDPPGMRLYRCGGCGEIKRACPRCEQRGWLRHYLVDATPPSRYVCDHCMATWDSSWRSMTPEQGVWPAEVWGERLRAVVDYEFPRDRD